MKVTIEPGARCDPLRKFEAGRAQVERRGDCENLAGIREAGERRSGASDRELTRN